MSDLEEALRMFRIAERDFSALRGMSDPTIFADEVFGFHAQQAVEKTLKAWLSARGQRYPFTHDLKELLSRLHDIGEDVDRFRTAVALSPYAMGLRYSANEDREPPINRGEMMHQVEEVLDFVRTLLAKG